MKTPKQPPTDASGLPGTARARAFDALAHPVRLRIVEMLTEGERSAGELSDAFEISRPAVSRHLRTLREAEILEWRSQGTERIYQLDPGVLDDLSRWLDRMRERWSGRQAALKSHAAKKEKKAKKKR
jgi:DNA-binding transcriptional ArsR family regulator